MDDFKSKSNLSLRARARAIATPRLDARGSSTRRRGARARFRAPPRARDDATRR